MGNHSDNQKSSIKDWALDDRPREKLLYRGKKALTDAELLGIIIGSGNAQESAVALMQRVLADCNNDLHVLSTKSVEELMQYKGIGEAKAISIVAMLELGRRRQSIAPTKRPTIESSKDARDVLSIHLEDLNHEEVWMLCLNQKSQLVKMLQVSVGAINKTLIDSRVLFKAALDHRAVSIIIAHNHPSGDPSPSQADIDITKRLFLAGQLLEIQLADHIIFGGNRYYSFREQTDILDKK